MTEGEPPILSPGFSSLSHSLLPRGNQWTALSSMCPFGMLCITISPDGVEPSVYNSKRGPKEPIAPWVWFLTSVLSQWQRVDKYRSQGILDLIKEVDTKPINYIWNATQGLWGQGRWGAHVQGKQGALQQKRGRKEEKGLVFGRDIQQLSSLGLVRLGQQSYSDFSEPWARYYLLCILPAGVRTDSSSLCGLLRRFSWDHAWKIVVQRQPTVSCLY